MAMATISAKAQMLEIPDLDASSCSLLRACGHFDNPDRQTRALLRALGKKPVFARIGAVYLVVVASPNGHLHIDVVPRSQLEDVEPPPLISVAKIRKFLSNFYGTTLTVELEAIFRLPVAKLPAIIKKQLLKLQSGAVTVEQVGAKLKVSGAPFHQIRWWLTDNDEARFLIEALSTLNLGREYLLNAFAPLESGFTALVFGGGENVPTE